MPPALQDVPPFEGHSPDQERAIGGYVAVNGLFAALVAAFARWFHAGGRELPDRVNGSDLALLTVSTHKLSRRVAKDRVFSWLRAPFTEFQGDAGRGEVDEQARGRGVRRALGELLIYPFCLGVWVATGFACGLLVAPRLTRLTMTVFTALFGADSLQIAYAKAESLLE